ncbi:hypothetical protein RRG08_052417 [Elysia crispata]|uniref:Uncharacterized protein n=1 Tax=Elysia crispata TaxID=231223 RepID=A0AAE1B3D3_9GAST|nr:hypothetical protein RRG08_052417 [Elysia crispata]
MATELGLGPHLASTLTPSVRKLVHGHRAMARASSCLNPHTLRMSGSAQIRCRCEAIYICLSERSLRRARIKFSDGVESLSSRFSLWHADTSSHRASD